MVGFLNKSVEDVGIVVRYKFGNDDLKAAAREWCKDSGKAEAKYGHISGWDTSEMTSMDGLFSAEKDQSYIANHALQGSVSESQLTFPSGAIIYANTGQSTP
ncbi:hypothetical protein TL16_g02367 [Triparma laevis f. inornata]|uniref:Uncharacterized protein n=2 Tax=Triparma laevis TaxID=1534972 RepID=A0A9W7KV41_9STRA|nr:hypothetical protein TL16_g02367 [Triparma laevis f. inornata]GMI12395.1 hypothetical protein TrLO_g13360 [Triparma laevis f. longispina]